jgi:hypothetical protein
MARAARNRERIVYILTGKRAQRLGTVTAPDREAAIAKAIDEFELVAALAMGEHVPQVQQPDMAPMFGDQSIA